MNLLERVPVILKQRKKDPKPNNSDTLQHKLLDSKLIPFETSIILACYEQQYSFEWVKGNIPNQAQIKHNYQALEEDAREIASQFHFDPNETVLWYQAMYLSSFDFACQRLSGGFALEKILKPIIATRPNFENSEKVKFRDYNVDILNSMTHETM